MKRFKVKILPDCETCIEVNPFANRFGNKPRVEDYLLARIDSSVYDKTIRKWKSAEPKLKKFEIGQYLYVSDAGSEVTAGSVWFDAILEPHKIKAGYVYEAELINKTTVRIFEPEKKKEVPL